jgi:predicted nucleic acid-binding protein
MAGDAGEIYLLDTNVFIEAYRRYYGLDLCPGFWDSVAHYCEEGRLLSIDRVRAEIYEGDSLEDWIKNAPESLFVSTADEAVVHHYQQIIAAVQEDAQFLDTAKAEFASVADGWLIAYAAAHGTKVVTHEVLNADIRRRVPIPNVAEWFEIDCVDTFDMLRELEVQFGWQAH